MTISCFYYNSTGFAGKPAVFLAGPTTDRDEGKWRSSFMDFELSTWRAQLAQHLNDLGWDGTLIIPEFSNKGRNGDWFGPLAKQHFGGGDGVLRWEEEMMIRADIVVGWADVNVEGPNVGLNARPELYGLLIRYRTSQVLRRAEIPQTLDLPWAPRKLAFGIPPYARKIARFREEAVGLTIHTTLQDLACEVVRLTK